MLADWSKANAAIEQIVHEYGRAGIPLYIAIPGNKGKEDGSRPAITLPELLKGPGKVIESLDKIAGK